MGEIREIVEAVLYLESAAFVTGETLHVDGGATRRPLVMLEDW
jgi:NAD(P)-dependent dehydrogenase (short-subunit alcohol dehydrogenase family)